MARTRTLDTEGASSLPVSPRVKTMTWIASKLKSAKAVSHVIYAWDEDETIIRLRCAGEEQELLFDVSKTGVFSGFVSVATRVKDPRDVPDDFEAVRQDKKWYAVKDIELFKSQSEMPANMLVPHIIVELRKQARALAN